MRRFSGWCYQHRPHFNPRTPCGVRPGSSKFHTPYPESFQSTHPVWGATGTILDRRSLPRISIHAPRVGCDKHALNVMDLLSAISIHAPRVGCDGLMKAKLAEVDISIHAPRVGCDVRHKPKHTKNTHFNPRTPCGVRLPQTTLMSPSPMNFNPRTPCGVRLRTHESAYHAKEFQSTHPVWGATIKSLAWEIEHNISIHAPRVGCDFGSLARLWAFKVFQSTHPVWGATYPNGLPVCGNRISIHAPRVGCDWLQWFGLPPLPHFNPRTPCGVRRAQ